MTAIKTLIASAAFAVTAFAASAQAQEFSFTYAPWQMQTSEGRAHVLNQLEQQVRSYCNVAEARGVLQTRIAQDCRDRTMARAVEQIGDARILALYEERERSRQA
ncbi:MAG: UrcA family protein [Caulobacterales bacterium]|uniref:UrcA family protein n=1 Tax=Glycocaulis sp. TaxID=1969725 RepID=UPI003FA062F5